MRRIAYKLLMSIVTITMVVSCGDECLYFCDPPEILTDCTDLTEKELEDIDTNSREFLEIGEAAKSLALMECIRDSGENFTNRRIVRWLVSYFEASGFGTTVGVFDVMAELIIAFTDNSGTTWTSIPGFPDMNEVSQSNYISEVDNVFLVRNQLTLPVESDISASLKMVDLIISLLTVNAYAYPHASIPLEIATQIPAARSSFIDEGLFCIAGDFPGGSSGLCGDSSAAKSLAVFVSIAFYQP